jgi:hypothetical protein
VAADGWQVIDSTHDKPSDGQDFATYLMHRPVRPDGDPQVY